MDVSQSRQNHQHDHLHHHQQHVVRWPTDWMHDWMHRSHKQLQLNNPFPPPLSVPAEPKRALSSSSSSSTSGGVRGVGARRGCAAAPTFSSSAMKMNSTRSSSAPKASSGPQLVTYGSRRHCSPCRKLQRSPQPRRSCQPGPTPSPDLLLADKAEWKRTLHDTTYRTYKALPRSNRPFDLRDYALLREILALAENLTQPEGAEVRLMDVLKAYDMVLQKHAMDPAEDTFYYRMLLKLSLSSEKDWWKRLNQEIVKNDQLLKVTSFRNHKLLLFYWLLWRCHHEKGARQEKGTKQGKFMEAENLKNCNGSVPKEEKQHALVPTVEQHKMKDGGGNQATVPFYMGDLPLEDTILVMDVVEVPVHASTPFKDFELKGAAPAFQAWQRVARQRKKKRCTREKNTQQWEQAVCFDAKNVIARNWRHLQRVPFERMIQASLWHENLLQQKGFVLWRRHSALTREICKAGKLFHEKRLCLAVLTEWRNYLSSLNALCKDLCKGRILWRWRRAVGFRKRFTQLMDHRLSFTKKRFLIQWRSRLQYVKKHREALYQCRKYHQIHVVSSCFQGWWGVCSRRAKCRRQRALCQQRYQKAVLQKWLAWIQLKYSLKQVLSICLSFRAQYLQKLSFSKWLSWWKAKKRMGNRKLTVLLHQKKRVLLQMLSQWETQMSRRKQMKDWLSQALQFHTLQLCRKSLSGWKLWQKDSKNKANRLMTIRKVVCGWQCKKLLLQWKELVDSKKKEEKGSSKGGQLTTPCEHKDQCLAQDTEVDGGASDRQDGRTRQSPQNSRRNQMKTFLLASKENIRKWKHFVEVKRTKGTNRASVVKYWTKFWLKTALEGWWIALQKKNLERNLIHSPKQLVTENKNPWFLMKLKLLKERTVGVDQPSKHILWRRLVLEKLSLMAWIQLNVIRKEQANIEVLYILRLKRWWVSTVLSHWRAVSQKYMQEKGKLYQTGHFMCEKEDKGILTSKEPDAFRKNSPQLLRMVSSDADLIAERLKLCFRFLRNHTFQLKAAKALQVVRKSTVLHYLWQQWKLATVEALQDRRKLALLLENLSKSPEKQRVIVVILEECPRWSAHKGFQGWKSWRVVKAAKRAKSRKAWEHLAGVLQAKALASFHAATISARTLRMSIKHFKLCYQVKSLLAWRTFSSEHALKTASKLSAVRHYRLRKEMMVLKKWSLYCHMSQREDFIKNSAEVFWRVLTLKKCLKAWIEGILKYKAKEQYLLWIKIRMDLHCLHNVLCAWRYSSQKKIIQQNHIESMREHRRVVCLYQRFHVWVWYIHRKKCVRAAQEMHRRRQLKSFFQSWVCKIMHLKFKKEAKETVREHIINKFCRTAFLVWRDLTVMARHARDTQWLAVNKIRQCRIIWALSRWKDVVRTQSFKHEVVHSAESRKKQRFFCTWVEVIRMQGKRTESQLSVTCMRQKRRVSLVFQIWLERSCDRKREREGSIQALILAHKSILAKVLKGFIERIHSRQMKEGFSLLACGKLQHVYMKRVFDAWLKQVEIYSRRQAAYHQLQRAWDRHLLAKSFDEFQGVVAENWRLRRRVLKALKTIALYVKLDNLVAWQRQKLCHSLLQHWRTRTISCMILRLNKEKFKTSFLRRALHEWRAFTQSKKHADLLARKVSVRHCIVLAKQCWQHWQFRTEKVQYQQQFLVFKTFRAWVKYMKLKAFKRCMERDAALMILRSLQKRVLWGWQSLVREIAIRRDEHQQQRFLQREAMVLANRTERRQKTEFLAAVFKAWQARCQQAMSIFMFNDKQTFLLKKSVWLFWLSWASLESHARRVRQQSIRLVLKSTLNFWRKTCARRIFEFKKREAEAAQFASWKLKHLVWPQWKSHVTSCKKRIKALQDCLALIQTGQDCDYMRGIIRAWKDYASERGKRREHSWAAEASYKRHKLADYLTAWHDYTAAAKESSSTLKGTIQVYKSSNSHVHAMVNSMYRFQRGFGHVSSYGGNGTSFHDIGAPTVVIEEVSSPVEESDAVLAHPSQWSTPQALLVSEGSQLARFMSSNGSPHPQSTLLHTGPLWNPSRSIKYLGLEIDDDPDDWSMKDVDVDASNN